MRSQFSRTESLLGPEKMDILRNSHVAVFGLGGVGSYAAESLARSGIYQLTLIDGDIIALSNANRQIHATVKTVGRWKTYEMKNRILDINTDATVHVVNEFILPHNISDVFQNWDFIIDAVDTVTAKLSIVETAFLKRIPVVSAMGTGNKLFPEMLMLDDIYNTQVCPLAKVMRKELKKRNIPSLRVCYSRENPLKPKASEYLEEDRGLKKSPPPGSVSFVPPVAGLLMAGEVVRSLASLSSE